MANYTEKANIAKTKKAFSTFAQGIKRIQADGFEFTSSDMFQPNSNPNFKEDMNMFQKTFAMEVRCNQYFQIGDCYGSVDEVTVTIPNYPLEEYALYNFALNNGVGFMTNWIISSYVPNSKLDIIFDINLESKPNTLGKDIHILAITDNGVVPACTGADAETIENTCKPMGLYNLTEYLQK